MATFNTALYLEQQETKANPSRLATPNVNSGTVEFAVVPYTLVGTEAITDIINLMLLPAGCIPMPQLSKVSCNNDPGTALVIDGIGTAALPDAFADGLTLSSGGTVEFMAGAFPAWVAATPIVADTAGGNALIQVKFSTMTAITGGVILYFLIAWKRGR